MSPGAPPDTSPAKRKGNPRGSGDRLRRELIDATDHLIEVRGDASALSLRAIAEHVGIATTSIYLHFADLTELKLAVAQRGFIEFAAARDQAAAGIADPMDALTARCLAYIDHAAAHPGRYRLMFGRQLANLAPNTSTGVPSNAALHALEDSIRQCTKAGAIAANIDPVRSAVLIWTALHGQASLQIDRPNFPWPPRRELVTDLVRRLLGVPAGDAQS
jgi:AcrR family transcriptional regulator